METHLDFESFYRSEYERVYRAAVLVAPDPQLALDATQGAFERAFARWRRLSKQEWAGGWVMTTALNLARGEHRKRGRAEQTSRPAAPVFNTDTLELREALAELPPRQRMAVVLFYIGDLPIHSIAASMGISDGAVKAHLSQRDVVFGSASEEQPSDTYLKLSALNYASYSGSLSCLAIMGALLMVRAHNGNR